MKSLVKKKGGGMTGKKHSPETKLKMREARLKNPSKHFIGKKFSEEHLLKMSIAQKRIGNRPPSRIGTKITPEQREKRRIYWQGEKNPRWKGGVTPKNHKIRTSFEYKLWREAVFKRDNWTCIWCGIKGRIQADHIKPFATFPELRFAIDNGRTLCLPCHKTTDSYPKNLK